jgi:hypothetical protein
MGEAVALLVLRRPPVFRGLPALLARLALLAPPVLLARLVRLAPLALPALQGRPVLPVPLVPPSRPVPE